MKVFLLPFCGRRKHSKGIMRVRTKLIIGFFLALAIVGSCTGSDKNDKNAPTTTTTANQVQTTITNPTTTSIPDASIVVPTTSSKPVPTTPKPVVAVTTSTTIKPVTIATTKPVTVTTQAPTTTTTQATTITTTGSFKTAGSYCAPVGSTGFTKTGIPVTCGIKDGEDRARWRSE